MRPIDGDRLIDSLESAKRGRGIEVDLVYSLIQEGIRQLPTLSVDDLRPKGRWIHKHSIYDSNIYICSNCKEQISILGNKLPSCPYCIADMRGGRKE